MPAGLRRLRGHGSVSILLASGLTARPKMALASSFTGQVFTTNKSADPRIASGGALRIHGASMRLTSLAGVSVVSFLRRRNAAMDP
jgi:hypothetical protein